MSALEVTWCGKRAKHDPHVHKALAFHGFSHVEVQCEGVRDQILTIVTMMPPRMESEILPALRRQMPGASFDLIPVLGPAEMWSDDLSAPDDWTRFRFIAIGLDFGTADWLTTVLAREISYHFSDEAHIRNVTDAEADTLASHHATAKEKP